MIVSLHVPKTAGTSFGEGLRLLFGRSIVLDYFHLEVPGVGPVDRVPDDAECVHGHFPVKRYLDRFPAATYATFTRDPVDRVLSIFHHWRRSPEPRDRHYQEIAAKGYRWETFLAYPGMQNTMLPMFAGKPVGSFDFVGCTEQYERSLVLFERATGLHVPLRAVNRRPASVSYDDAGLRAAVAERNGPDLEFHAQAMQRFEELCARHGVPPGARHARRR